MTTGHYHERSLQGEPLSPETLMMCYGYSPSLSEGAIKPPVFLTSTFVFRSAQEGKDFFDYASGRRQPPANQAAGLVYSRFNNPNLEMAEDRLAVWEGAEAALVFSSGMSAIATTLLTFLRPGDVVLTSQPLYGGTEVLIEKTLSQYGIRGVSFDDGCSAQSIRSASERALELAREHKGRVAMVLLETPANPTNALVDIALVRQIADELALKQGGARPVIAVDNTFLGPIFQKPLQHGADLSLYSLTKYVGGHSDLVAGGVAGRRELITQVRSLRGALGTQLDPHTSWMLTRSMETLSLRMERGASNALEVANFLCAHPKVASVSHLGLLPADDPRLPLFRRQCVNAGSTFSFRIKGGEPEAFRLLDSLKVVRLAVSLGGTETLTTHPASTTHSGVPLALRQKFGVTDDLIRLSVGIESSRDIIADLRQALDQV